MMSQTVMKINQRQVNFTLRVSIHDCFNLVGFKHIKHNQHQLFQTTLI